jgi:hypothetical protein
MAISTIDSYLLDGGLATGVQTFTVPLVAINDMPDLEGEREEIDVTTLSDSSRTFIEGLKNNAPWVFTCNYTKTAYEALLALAGLNKHYGVFLGPLSTTYPTGSDGMWATTGTLSVKKTAGAKGEAHEMSVKIVPTSGVTFYALPTIVGATMSSPVESAAVSLSAIKYVGVPVTPTLAYQWYTAATETGSYSTIGGATSATYTPGEDDAGDWIKCRITATGTATGVIYTTPAVVVAN